MGGFAACFADLTDPRTGNAARHDLLEMLVIALCSVLTGGEDCTDMAEFAVSKIDFLRGFLKLKHGAPSHDTFSRLFRLLDPDQFRACFQRFMASFAEACQGVVAIDGKVLRRSFDTASQKSALHMVSAWACEQQLVLAQIATEEKSNEITAIPKLLRLISLRGSTVTVDALNCQRAIAQQVVDQEASYVMALKGNQQSLHDDVRRFFDDPQSKVETAKPVVDGDHGRIETRIATVSTDIDWLQGDPSLARACGDRQNGADTRERPQDHYGDGVLSPQFSADARTVRRGHALPLGDREPTALAARCQHGRGSTPQKARQRPPQSGRASPHGPQSFRLRQNQGFLAQTHPSRRTQ